MKVSFVSSQAISQALRYQTARLQTDLAKATKELGTLRVADTGLALGARTSISVSLNREMSRLQGLIDSNKLAATRLETTQRGLQELTNSAGNLLGDYSTALTGVADPSIVKQQAAAMLSSMASILNGNLSGENIYAGINTDVQPFADFLDPASPNRVAFDTAFASYPFADPADITAAEMDAFLTSVEPQFLGAGWQGTWSQATDQTITSRITLTETAQTSVSANSSGFRKLAMAAAIVAATVDGSLSEEARNAVVNRGIALLGEAITDLGNQQSHTGITEQRLDKANERLTMQMNLFSSTIQELEGVDEYEVTTRVNSLRTQIEISYSLTSSMRQLSLLNYLS